MTEGSGNHRWAIPGDEHNTASTIGDTLRRLLPPYTDLQVDVSGVLHANLYTIEEPEGAVPFRHFRQLASGWALADYPPEPGDPPGMPFRNWGAALDSLTLRTAPDDVREPIDVRVREDGLVFSSDPSGGGPVMGGSELLVANLLAEHPHPVRFWGVIWGKEAPNDGVPDAPRKPDRFFTFRLANGSEHRIPFDSDPEFHRAEVRFAIALNARNRGLGKDDSLSRGSRFIQSTDEDLQPSLPLVCEGDEGSSPKEFTGFRRGRGRPPKTRSEAIDGRPSVVRIGTSQEMQTIHRANFGYLADSSVTSQGLSFRDKVTGRSINVVPPSQEIKGESQVAEYVRKIMAHRGPVAVKALMGALRLYDERVGLAKPGTVHVYVSDLLPYCGYTANPKTQTIRDLANGLLWISRIEVEVEKVLKWGTKGGRPVPLKTVKTAGRPLNLERRGYLKDLLAEDPDEGEVSSYWVEFSVPEWLREQLSAAGGGSGQMWWPMVGRVLSYDAVLERPMFCLGIYLASILRMGAPGSVLIRTAEEIAKASGWEPNGKTTRWLESLKRFLVQLHKDMPECVPEPTFRDPLDSCPGMSPSDRFRGFRVEWRRPLSMLASLGDASN